MKNVKPIQSRETVTSSKIFKKVEVNIYNKKVKVDVSEESIILFISQLEESNIELTSIKSKWWYKLMTWGWN